MKVSRLSLLGLLSLLLIITSHVPAAAKDEWLAVRSKNFYVVGNASEAEIRKVATKLEQFRETFRLLFKTISLTSPIQTNVVVFKNDASFRPFKPKTSDGKTEDWLAGFFQSGEDVNYIAVSTEREDSETFGTIYHEYVHFIVNTNFGKSEVPPWFNEGLAEYYQTFEIAEDQKIKLGLPQADHLALLRQTNLIPLSELFKVSSRQLHESTDNSRNIFYAESWALVHYLLISGRGDSLNKFLLAVLKGTPEEKAFQDAFQMTYAQMETELKKYVDNGTFKYSELTLKNKLTFDSEMQTAAVSDAEISGRLGDLLYHTDRIDDAEPYLLAALKQDPNLSMANTTMGMVKLRQRKYDEAKLYLEKATSGDQKNYLAYYRYAYLLSRDGRDEFGYVRTIPPEIAAKARTALKHAIALAPEFCESYDLLAFVALVTNEQLDEALTLMQRAMKLQPGTERYAMRVAELYLKKGQLDEALAMTPRFDHSDDDRIRERAESIRSEIRDKKELAIIQQRRDAMKAGDNPTGPSVASAEKKLSEEEVKKLEEQAIVRSINEALRQPAIGEKRVIGRVQKVECRGMDVSYQIRTADGTLNLGSNGFQRLTVIGYVREADNASLGCTRDLSTLNAVVTYKEDVPRSELVAVEFVPASFRFLTKEEMANKDPIVYTDSNGRKAFIAAGSDPAELEKARREMVMKNVKEAIRQPAAGEKRELGYLETIDCSDRRVFFVFKTGAGTLRLLDLNPASLPIRVFAPDMSGMQFDCGTSVMNTPAVVVYTNRPDAKLRTAGEIVALDFVPKSFTLN